MIGVIECHSYRRICTAFSACNSAACGDGHVKGCKSAFTCHATGCNIIGFHCVLQRIALIEADAAITFFVNVNCVTCSLICLFFLETVGKTQCPLNACLDISEGNYPVACYLSHIRHFKGDFRHHAVGELVYSHIRKVYIRSVKFLAAVVYGGLIPEGNGNVILFGEQCYILRIRRK